MYSVNKHAFYSLKNTLIDQSDLCGLIIMFLSAVWTLILTVPIHCRRSIGEEVMYIYHNLFGYRNKLIYILDSLEYIFSIFFSFSLVFLLENSSKYSVLYAFHSHIKLLFLCSSELSTIISYHLPIYTIAKSIKLVFIIADPGITRNKQFWWVLVFLQLTRASCWSGDLVKCPNLFRYRYQTFLPINKYSLLSNLFQIAQVRKVS